MNNQEKTSNEIYLGDKNLIVSNLVCKICFRDFKSLKSLSLHLWQTHKIKSVDYYNSYLKKDKDGFCIMCGKKIRCVGLRGYFPTCSTQCGNKNQEVIEKIKETFKRNNVIQKIRKNLFDKFGVYNVNQTPSGRLRCRKNAIRQIEIQKFHGEPLSPRIGTQERLVIAELQKYISLNIIKQDGSFRYQISRIPDGYINELKLVVLYHERRHYLDQKCTLETVDSSKATDQYKLLGLNVFIISEWNWKNNKQQVIHEFKEMINGLESRSKNCVGSNDRVVEKTN